MQTQKEGSMKPSRKVAAGGLAGALTTIVVFIATQLGLDVPAEVAAAVTTLFATGLAYLVPNG
jgi:hypothetical protein